MLPVLIPTKHAIAKIWLPGSVQATVGSTSEAVTGALMTKSSCSTCLFTMCFAKLQASWSVQWSRKLHLCWQVHFMLP